MTGKPNKNIPIEVQSLARAYTKLAINTLSGIAGEGQSEAARVAAAGMLLDRGWGKSPQPVTGKDGEEPIEVIVRTIIEGNRK